MMSFRLASIFITMGLLVPPIAGAVTLGRLIRSRMGLLKTGLPEEAHWGKRRPFPLRAYRAVGRPA